MEKAKITFLGTGSAIPTKLHNHIAMLLSFKGENILFDCGEGTQRQFRIAGLNPCKLTRIFITHWHADHVLGIPGLLQTLMLNHYSKTLKVYGPRGTKKMMKLYQALFAPRRDKIKIEVREVKGKFLETEDFLVQAESMKHGTPSLAYSFIIKEKSRLNKKKFAKLRLQNSPLIAELKKGKTIKLNRKKINGKSLIYKEPERKITFIMDTLLNKNCRKIARNSDLLICESTYSSEEKNLAKEHLHLISAQAAYLALKSKSKKLILTHISQRYEKQPEIILNQARNIFKNSEIVNDFDSLEI